MGNNNKGKRKLLTQRHVCSRMNFLYQAANLMAHGNNNTLAAYYGKLCRNVGTKALMHMSPAIKRTLCKRCSMPLLLGVNTTLKLEEKVKPKQSDQQQKPKENVRSRHRRMRRKRRKDKVIETPSESTAILDEQTRLQLECSLCGAHRRFAVNTQNECWLDRTDAIVQVLTLDRQTDEDGKKQRENKEEGDGEEL